jgi:hypothetical protein
LIQKYKHTHTQEECDAVKRWKIIFLIVKFIWDWNQMWWPFVHDISLFSCEQIYWKCVCEFSFYDLVIYQNYHFLCGINLKTRKIKKDYEELFESKLEASSSLFENHKSQSILNFNFSFTALEWKFIFQFFIWLKSKKKSLAFLTRSLEHIWD